MLICNEHACRARKDVSKCRYCKSNFCKKHKKARPVMFYKNYSEFEVLSSRYLTELKKRADDKNTHPCFNYNNHIFDKLKKENEGYSESLDVMSGRKKVYKKERIVNWSLPNEKRMLKKEKNRNRSSLKQNRNEFKIKNTKKTTMDIELLLWKINKYLRKFMKQDNPTKLATLSFIFLMFSYSMNFFTILDLSLNFWGIFINSIKNLLLLNNIPQIFENLINLFFENIVLTLFNFSVVKSIYDRIFY